MSLMKLTANMIDELEHVLAAERAGWLGLDADRIPNVTYRALRRRGLITTPNVDGSISLTASGRSFLASDRVRLWAAARELGLALKD